MNKRSFFFASLIFCGFISACISDDSDNIDSLIEGTDNLAPPTAPYSKRELSSEDFEKEIDGKKYNCRKTKYSFCQNFEEFIGSDPNTQALYPGSIVKGKGLRDGVLTSIGDIDRRDMTFTLVGANSITANPSLSNATTAVNDLLDNTNKAPNAQTSYTHKEVHSVEQGLVELGLDFKILNTGIQSQLSSGYSNEYNYVYILFKQAYDIITVENPSEPSGFFGSSVTTEDLKSLMSDESPLCYISSVTYGRLYIAEFKSTASKKDLNAAIGVSYGLADFNSGYQQNSLLEEAEIKVLALGGSTDAASVRTPQALYNLIDAGRNPDRSIRPYPISYKVRHVSDNSLVKIGNPIEYTVEECDLDPESIVNLELRDLRFDIIDDCDFWGPGDFYYSIDVVDETGTSLLTNGKIESSQTDTIEKSNGESIVINGTRRFSVEKSNGGYFEVVGFLQQQQASGSFELVGNIKEQHYSPYSNLNTSTITLESSSDCEAEFSYRLREY